MTESDEAAKIAAEDEFKSRRPIRCRICLWDNFSAHDFFTRHPERWIEFISIYLGTEKYGELRTKALKGTK